MRCLDLTCPGCGATFEVACSGDFDPRGQRCSDCRPEPPAVVVKATKVEIPRAAVGQRLILKAEQWARRNGEKLKRRDRKMVEEARKGVDNVRQSGREGPMRLAARLPGRWFAEKKLALGDDFTANPERIKHEAKKDNLWLRKDD